jgi:hypothetical protein
VPLAKYIRDVIGDHLKEIYYSRKSGVVHLEALVRTVKEYILTWRGVGIAGLPAVERRARLEALAWKAVEQAYEFTKSEEAAENAIGRMIALRTLASVTRVELAILNSQDEAFVDELIEALEVDANAAEEQTKTSGRQKTGST